MQHGPQPQTVFVDQSVIQTTSPTIGEGIGHMQAGFGRPATVMSFLDSIISVLTNYAGFEGRASRSEYWWFYLAIVIVSVPISIIDIVIFGFENDAPACFSWLFNLAILLPVIAVSIRRMHDLGKSGWYNLIPFYNIILLASEGESVPNTYGPVPTNTRNGNPATSYVVVQQPLQQQYQQQIVQTTAQGNNDNFWAVNDVSEAYTTPHNEMTPTQVTSQYSNLNVNTMPQTSGQYIVVSSPNNGGGKTGAMIIVGIVIGAALLVVLSGVLYVWASNLAENQPSELVGDWTNPEDKLELESDGKAKESTGTFETWYTMDGKLYFEDGEYYYEYKYSIVNEILFMAPYDENDVLLEDDCMAYLKGLNGESESYYNDRINQADSNGEIPNWCD